ncbi:hypothetical protein EV1_027878 [Malus domestica]
MALEESTIVHHPFIQDQAPTALWIHNINKSTCPTVLQDQAQKPLKICSSLFLQDQAQKPLKIRSSPLLKIKPQRLLEESTIVHHPFIQDQAPTALWIHNINKSTRPTVLQDQAQKPLKICSSLFLQDQAQKPLKIRSSPLLKIKPQRLLEDSLKSTFKDQAHNPLKKLPTVHPRSSPDGPWINCTSIQSTPYGDRIRGSK